MNIFKQWYLRIFKGYCKTDEIGMQMISLFTIGSPKVPKYIKLGHNSWLISPPNGKV